MSDNIIQAAAERIEQQVNQRRPVDTGSLRRKALTGSFGMPVWLYKLMQDAGWDSPYVLAIEVGGRGVLHPTLGWVGIEELKTAAEGRGDE